MVKSFHPFTTIDQDVRISHIQQTSMGIEPWFLKAQNSHFDHRFSGLSLKIKISIHKVKRLSINYIIKIQILFSTVISRFDRA